LKTKRGKQKQNKNKTNAEKQDLKTERCKKCSYFGGKVKDRGKSKQKQRWKMSDKRRKWVEITCCNLIKLFDHLFIFWGVGPGWL
jgi:hypothetical protein